MLTNALILMHASARLRNIEKTERAKWELMEHRKAQNLARSSQSTASTSVAQTRFYKPPPRQQGPELTLEQARLAQASHSSTSDDKSTPSREHSYGRRHEVATDSTVSDNSTTS